MMSLPPKPCDKCEDLAPRALSEIPTSKNKPMKPTLLCIAITSALAAELCLAQTNQPPVEDFKPSSINQPGKQYPQVNSERRVRARVSARQATNVLLDIGAVEYH